MFYMYMDPNYIIQILILIVKCESCLLHFSYVLPNAWQYIHKTRYNKAKEDVITVTRPILSKAPLHMKTHIQLN